MSSKTDNAEEMPVIPVDKVVDKKRIIRKMEGRGGGEAQGVADPKKQKMPMFLPHPDSPSERFR
jgi:hypothetical protein